MWCARPESPRSINARIRLSAIRAIHQASREPDGSPSIWDALLKQGHRIGEYRVARLMRQAGLRAKTVTTWRATTQSQHQFPVAANTRDRAVTVEAPNRVWAGDRTDGWPLAGWRDRAVLIDLSSRRVVGWATGRRLTVDLAERALTMALATRAPTARLRHRSDRGSQDAATSDQHGRDADGLLPGMSRNGWDHACVERVFGTLTRGLVSHRRDATRDEATPDSVDSIEVFDNRKRRHSTLGDDSPAEYDARTGVA